MFPTNLPFPTFSDLSGNPLNAGKIYFGEPDDNPITAPIVVYWDAAGTQPADQPIRTLNGYPVRHGTPARVYANEDYSILVNTAGGQQVYYAPNSADFDPSATLAASTGSSMIGYTNGGTPNSVAAALDILYYGTANVRNTRFAGGAVGDGVTDDTAAFQAAIDHAKTTGAAVIIPYPAGGFYNITGALDLSVSGAPNLRGLSLIGIGGTCQDLPAIKLKHTGVGFDCTGGAGYLFRDLNIGTDATTFPKTAFLFARNSTNGSAGRHRMINCRIVGKFSKANLYTYGSEENEYIANCFTNQLAGVDTKVVCLTANNILSLTSTFQTIATGAQSNLVHVFHGGQYYNMAGVATADCFYLDMASGFRLINAWGYSASATVNGRAIVMVNTAFGTSDYGSIIGLTGEASTHLQGACIYLGDTLATMTGWVIEGCRLPSGFNAIYVHPNVTIDNFHIKCITESSSLGMSALGTVQKSTINSHDMLLAIGTASHCIFMGNAAQWTIGVTVGGANLSA